MAKTSPSCRVLLSVGVGWRPAGKKSVNLVDIFLFFQTQKYLTPSTHSRAVALGQLYQRSIRFPTQTFSLLLNIPTAKIKPLFSSGFIFTVWRWRESNPRVKESLKHFYIFSSFIFLNWKLRNEQNHLQSSSKEVKSVIWADEHFSSRITITPE